MNFDIIICGCVRNCSKYIDDVFINIGIIQNNFNVKKIVLAYDCSIDDTLKKIQSKSKDYNIEILHNVSKLDNERTTNICNARNKLLNYLSEYSVNNNLDYFIMMDFDDVCSKMININVLKNAFTIEWDAVSFNNKKYYDYWALSFDKFLYSCWHSTNPRQIICHMHKTLQEKLNNNNYIEVYSAFNGFCVYKFNKFKHLRYKNFIDLSIFPTTLEEMNKNINYTGIVYGFAKNYPYDCEHRYFHMTAKQQNCKIIIYNDFLFPEYDGEHCVILP